MCEINHIHFGCTHCLQILAQIRRPHAVARLASEESSRCTGGLTFRLIVATTGHYPCVAETQTDINQYNKIDKFAVHLNMGCLLTCGHRAAEHNQVDDCAFLVHEDLQTAQGVTHRPLLRLTQS